MSVFTDSYSRPFWCQYLGCQEEATIWLKLLAEDSNERGIQLCDAHIADWGMHWRDSHSEVIEELE